MTRTKATTDTDITIPITDTTNQGITGTQDTIGITTTTDHDDGTRRDKCDG